MIAEVRERPTMITLTLQAREPEVIAELSKYNDEAERNDFALSALRIGVLALRQASGVLDANTVRVEGERLMSSVREMLGEKTSMFSATLTSALKTYLDPTDGHLHQRIERLIRKDGELHGLLSQHLNGDESVIAKTLTKHLGADSPMLRLLSPEESKGVVAALSKTTTEALQSQKEQVLRQFSLDDKESALSRLVVELTGANGKLRDDLAEDVQKLHKEFSLDNAEGALARLVGRVEKAQGTISEQFSLDNKDSALNKLTDLMQAANAAINANLTLDDDKSPLSRLRRGLTEIIEKLVESHASFHEEVKGTLAAFKVRKEESARSTRHGGEFEEAVGDMLLEEAQRAGDVVEATGNTTGAIGYCKVGDHVITLGSESAAPGAKIAVESKEDRSYDLAAALVEIEQARKNRQSQVGVFVFSKATAPPNLEPFSRHGKLIVVVWDRDDPSTDIFLRVGVSVAKALVVRDRASDEKSKDAAAMKSAVLAIAKDVSSLAEISKWATTVKRSGDKIGKRAESLKKKLGRHLLVLDSFLGGGEAGITDTAVSPAGGGSAP